MLRQITFLFVVLSASIWGQNALAQNAPVEDAIDEKFPLGTQLRVLAGDVANPTYRKLVLEKMLITDLAAEWQRMETEDNADSFAKKHGGLEKVQQNPDLKKAYERRLAIRSQFLELMRQGYQRYKRVPPFDTGAKAEAAGTTKRETTNTLSLSTVSVAEGADRYWPRFRGPTGQGITNATNPPTTWSKEGENILWRTKTTGVGNSSPIVWGARLILTSSDPKGVERFVHCYDRNDGKLLWTQQAPSKPPEEGVRDKNGFASATPATDGEHIVVFLGSCGLLCYDFDGKLLWHQDELKFKTTHGTGTSPLLYKDKVIFCHDQNKEESLCIALDKRTGKILWRTKRKQAMGWSTPVIVRLGERDELVYAGANTVRGYDPETGAELWVLDGPTEEVVPTVVVGKSMIYSASGRNGPTLGLLPGGKGNVTKTHLVWRTVRGGPLVPSPLFLDNRLYSINDFGIASCFDATTGDVLWQGRLDDSFSASPIEANGLLYCSAESGVTYVLRQGDKLEVVARNDLGAPILASPAVVDGKIYIRTQSELVCIGKK